jgi:hypothetical protein
MKIKTMLLKSEINSKSATLMDDHGISYRFANLQTAEENVKNLGYNLVYQESAATLGCVAMYTKYIK